MIGQAIGWVFALFGAIASLVVILCAFSGGGRD